MLEEFKRERFDILLQGGQSNAMGCGVGEVTVPYEDNDDVLYFEGDFSIARPAPPNGDFALSFAGEYLRNGLLEKGRKLLIIRSAAGGIGFLNGKWGLKDEFYLRMIEMVRVALSLNPENRLVAFLWHQGEADAEHGAPRTVHYKNLAGLVNSVRGTFGVPTLPFITADLVHDWRYGEHMQACEEVVGAMIDVCTDIGHARFVLTGGLGSNRECGGNEDVIHFSRESLRLLGIRYFNAYCGLRGLCPALQ